MINKRFPADTHIADEDITFLHDKKINGELYSFLQSISIVKEGSTQIMKSKMPI